ncbi:MAG TPA: amidohydrolase family protein [Steroidobacteraceae bacterium]|nr:amidohydrolase family protein [Steroidobacteraceae bacterium]
MNHTNPFAPVRVAALVAALGLSHLAAAGGAAPVPRYDVVFDGVRAIDPQTGLDAVRNVAILGGKIAAISEQPLQGKTVVDGRGLVAAPGFIDLHSHAYGYETATYQAMDGITTRLELEVGVYPVKRWYEKKAGHELINYGASVSHDRVRASLQVGGNLDDPKIPGETFFELSSVPGIDALIHQPIPPQAYARFIPMLEAGLKDGAIGIGSGTQYAPGITHPEMLDLTRLAAQRHMCVFTHIRFGSLVEPGSTLEAIQEQIANAAITGACVHIVHINSMAMSSTGQMIRLFHDARDHGVDVSTEIYPWDASVDEIRSVIFDPGWEKRWGVSVGDLQSTATGKRLTQQEFDALRSGTGDDGVLMHMNSEETITKALQDPLVLVASDSMDIKDQYSHPRSAGTFARVLGHYVRETGALSLTQAIRKMSLMPAQRLEAFVPAMKHKGRLQVGADADLVVFDPAQVRERARYLDAKQYSIGMRYVLVNGTFVVRKGAIVKSTFPGQPVYSYYRRP